VSIPVDNQAKAVAVLPSVDATPAMTGPVSEPTRLDLPAYLERIG
jgi:hypothetical protein